MEAASDPDDGWSPAGRAIRDARLPSLGTPERDRLDRDQATILAGLLAGRGRHAGASR